MATFQIVGICPHCGQQTIRTTEIPPKIFFHQLPDQLHCERCGGQTTKQEMLALGLLGSSQRSP